MENSTEILDKLASILGKSSINIISSYSEWFFYSSISWVLFGFIIMFASRNIEDPTPEKSDGFTPLLWVVSKYCGFGIGLLFIFSNVTELFSPKGYAIHQLLKDIAAITN